jgi:hypothetical protein
VLNRSIIRLPGFVSPPGPAFVRTRRVGPILEDISYRTTHSTGAALGQRDRGPASRSDVHEKTSGRRRTDEPTVSGDTSGTRPVKPLRAGELALSHSGAGHVLIRSDIISGPRRAGVGVEVRRCRIGRGGMNQGPIRLWSRTLMKGKRRTEQPPLQCGVIQIVGTQRDADHNSPAQLLDAVERLIPSAAAIWRSLRPAACLRRRISRTRRICSLWAGVALPGVAPESVPSFDDCSWSVPSPSRGGRLHWNQRLAWAGISIRNGSESTAALCRTTQLGRMPPLSQASRAEQHHYRAATAEVSELNVQENVWQFMRDNRLSTLGSTTSKPFSITAATPGTVWRLSFGPSCLSASAGAHRF